MCPIPPTIDTKKNPSIFMQMQLISLSLSLFISLPMAAKLRKKKTNKLSFLCSCFGISSKVSADHPDGKSFSGRRRKGAALPVNDHKIPPSSEIVASSKEIIHVVEDDEQKRSELADDFLSDNKTRDKTSEKSKNSSTPPVINEETKAVVVGRDTWTNHRKLSHSVSLPVLQHQKRERPAAAAEGGEFDSMLGAVIITVTLVVMMIWGKIWASVCTAAWFYFIPRFRAKLDESYAMKLKNGESESNRVDLDSWEHKKKVVLQGLLHRNQSL